MGSCNEDDGTPPRDLVRTPRLDLAEEEVDED